MALDKLHGQGAPTYPSSFSEGGSESDGGLDALLMSICTIRLV
jgi:hypothetical protein